MNYRPTAADQAHAMAKIHAERCRRCSRPIIDADANLGLATEACVEGRGLLLEYARSLDAAAGSA